MSRWSPVGDERPGLSRRGARRINRQRREVSEELQAICRERRLTSVVWRTVARNPTFGFTTAERWQGVVFDERGDFVAAVWDVPPVDADGIERQLLDELKRPAAMLDSTGADPAE